MLLLNQWEVILKNSFGLSACSQWPTLGIDACDELGK
tara:strand:+ start:794 stop:904 length:111 start_codon:yes stop_codon:yes gene_type:complete